MTTQTQRQLLDGAAIALQSALPLFGDSPVQELLPTIENFLSIADNLPESITLNVPLNTSPQNYAPAGQPRLLVWKALNEIKDWAYVAQCLPLYKIRQLILSYLSNIIDGSFLISAMAARAIIETAAISYSEWNETKDKSTPLYSIKPFTIKNIKKEQSNLDNTLSIILPLITHFRILLQRSRTDWYSLTDPEASKEEADRFKEKVRQKNVLTAIDKLKFPETALGKTTREQYEVICDFVHPNRGSHTLFINESIIENGFVNHVYIKNPNSIELVQVVLQITATSIIYCLRTVATTYEEWNALLGHLRKVIHGSRIYLP